MECAGAWELVMISVTGLEPVMLSVGLALIGCTGIQGGSAPFLRAGGEPWARLREEVKVVQIS